MEAFFVFHHFTPRFCFVLLGRWRWRPTLELSRLQVGSPFGPRIRGVARQNSDLLLNHGNEPAFGQGCVRAILVIFGITRTKSPTIRAIGVA